MAVTGLGSAGMASMLADCPSNRLSSFSRKVSQKRTTVGLDRRSVNNAKRLGKKNIELPSASTNETTDEPELVALNGSAELSTGPNVTKKSNMEEREDMRSLAKNEIELPSALPNEIANDTELVALNCSAEPFTGAIVPAQSIIAESTDTQSLKMQDNDSQGGHSGVRIEDLMTMIKDAEKNILLLNKARISSLEELDQARAEKDSLQGEINLLKCRLAETDARLKQATQEKIKNEFLEGELERLKREIAERESIWKGTQDLKVHNKDFQERSAVLKSHISNSSATAHELDEIKAEKKLLKEEVNVLKSKLSNMETNNQHVAELEKESLSVKHANKQLESRLAIAEAKTSELANVKAECQVLRRRVEDLQAELKNSVKSRLLQDDVVATRKALEEKICRLEEALHQSELDKDLLEHTLEENSLLREQVKILEQRLNESDNDIRSQLKIYQQEVETFQRSLELLKKKSKRQSLDEPVQELPWEFWSNLLLSLDGWMLEKKITIEDAKILREMAWRRSSQLKDVYVQCQNKNENDVIASLMKLTRTSTRPGLHVVHIAAEMAPIAKVGGLGDVVAGLGKALQKKGHLVEIILPKYDCMDYSRIGKLKVLDVQIDSYFDGRLFKNKIWSGTVEGLPVYFIEPHHPAKFFWRGQIYGEGDDFRRFTFFCRAALEFILQSGKKPEIIHCHDWQTAFVAPLYWDIYAPQGLNSARIAFTCHNFEYQGTESAAALAACGLDVQQLNRPDRMQDNFKHDRINAVKGGIVFSNIVTTVSPTYAEEVRGSEGGKGLQSTLAAHSKKFIGILNGIDTEAWDPSTDPLLDFQYSADDLSGKAQSKAALQKILGLAAPHARIPLVGCITRLVPQKGVHLIRHAIYQTLKCGGQFVLLGSSPVPHIQREFEGIANQFCEHPSIRLVLKYDEGLSHHIFAASDLFIIPSIFEPCGLTQMIAMRYGSIPIVRRTGGLNDSVFDVDDETIPLQIRNGFTFTKADEQGINNALERSFTYYKQKPNWWIDLVKKTMNMDFSWDSSAAQYEELYEKAVARAKSQQVRIPIATR
ncbi:probable starch synthase 4, chloroplastic/amyloplastic isoform X2 [Cryptomeria japonica]|uniref:probable starch synthase 4, chloroplastic/amyloplastic isoform X2 n=1 Tax=Cryptomeria japonica TaxID=3369 RepID=UPI0025AD18BD|nr:probable starch synthase 4, chloroplastic/amyloplastic isoform X2 [Cryptomeria japonica]